MDHRQNDQEKNTKLDHLFGKLRMHHWLWISAFLCIYDLLTICVSFGLALWIRFDFRMMQIDSIYLTHYAGSIWAYALCCIVVYFFLKLYNRVWRFAGYTEMMACFIAVFVSFILYWIIMDRTGYAMPNSYFIIGAFLQFTFLIGIRLSYRLYLSWRSRRGKHSTDATVPVMLIGGGAAGELILRDIKNSNTLNEKVACIIDDNANKWNRLIGGVRVVGGRESIVENAKRFNIQKIYVAIPTASAKDKAAIFNICNETGCKLKNLPGLYQLINGEVKVSALREVALEDLLGRDPICVNNDEIFEALKDRVILVTGGGGSIGSELCRQIAAHTPKQLIIFDIYENNAYDIQMELKRKYPALDLQVMIGSVRDIRRVHSLFNQYRPEIVLHAAAHKHVPLMEDSPNEAIKNNVFGTYNVAMAAVSCHCQKFVLISTDKAVNPTNIMGASKRLCEMVIQMIDRKIENGTLRDLPMCLDGAAPLGFDWSEAPFETNFAAVRFGNVLGSNGSVIPLFKKQIAEGGPVTVTDPRINRFFMTIPEAVSLVLQAGAYAKGGEIFVLDMGEPVKIDTLARNLIRLSGLKPDLDIAIQYTGLRPGEKLYEEKLMAEEGMQKTANDLIFIGHPIDFDENGLVEKLQQLSRYIKENETTDNPNTTQSIRKAVAEIVGTYHWVAAGG